MQAGRRPASWAVSQRASQGHATCRWAAGVGRRRCWGCCAAAGLCTAIMSLVVCLPACSGLCVHATCRACRGPWQLALVASRPACGGRVVSPCVEKCGPARLCGCQPVCCVLCAAGVRAVCVCALGLGKSLEVRSATGKPAGGAALSGQPEGGRRKDDGCVHGGVGLDLPFYAAPRSECCQNVSIARGSEL